MWRCLARSDMVFDVCKTKGETKYEKAIMLMYAANFAAAFRLYGKDKRV